MSSLMSVSTVNVVLASVLIVGSLFAIASSSIGIQLFNEDSSKKSDNMTKFNFLVINLVLALLILFFGIGTIIYPFLFKQQ